MNRIIRIDSLDKARKELGKISVSSQGVELMAYKAVNMIVKITDVHVGAANILKQEMLSIGGDAAVARGVVNGTAPVSDVILLANADKIKKLIRKLHYQTIFGLPQICADLEKFLAIETHPKNRAINCRGKKLSLDSMKIMGILNVTPDSFSDGSKYNTLDRALDRSQQMIAAGVDIIDIGGESTRPGAATVSLAEELDRVIPVIEKIRASQDVIISIDTYKADVAREALNHGADIINDISALRFDDEMISLLREFDDVPIIIMHMQGSPSNMQKKPYYNDVVDEICNFLNDRIGFLNDNGIENQRIIIDPGIGFGKRLEDNLTILNELHQFRSLNVPILLGASRKSFIGNIYESNPEDRLEGSLATTALAFHNNIELVRVHDVVAHRRFIDVLERSRSGK